MGGLIAQSQPVDAGLGSGVTITGTQPQVRSTDQMLGLSSEQWIALSAMLNAIVLLLTLGVMISEL